MTTPLHLSESDSDVPYELIVSASNLIVDRLELHYGIPMTRPVADDLAERVLLLAARRAEQEKTP